MKLEIIKAGYGKLTVGEHFTPTTETEGKRMIKEGFAKDITATEPEKELVLLNPEPGVWTTGYKEKATGKVDQSTVGGTTGTTTVNPAAKTPVATQPATDANKK